MSAMTIRLCGDCDRKLLDASTTLRRHASEMNRALQLVRAGSVTEDQVQDLRNNVWASLNDAEAAWDTYRQHLIEHGLVRQT